MAKKMYLCIPNVMKRLSIISFLLLVCAEAIGQSFIPKEYAIPFPTPLAAPYDTVEVVVIGDVMMHAKQLDYDYRTFLEPVRPLLENADLAVANMEFALAGKPYSGYPSFSAPDGYAEYVRDCGVDVFLLANNHILDKGTSGLSRTLKVYSDMEGIRYTGAAADRKTEDELNPLIVPVKGIRLAFVNFTYGTNMGEPGPGYPTVRTASREKIARDIARARKAKVDYIIALPHWGTEYQLTHSAWQKDWAEWLVGQGVDAIVGGHPHVVQDTTHIKGVPVIYSMGNAISNMSAINTRLELAVRLRFVKHMDEAEKMLEPELVFLWCTLPGRLSDTYATISVEEYKNGRSEWINPSDYDNMTATLERVKSATGIR